jgi:aryl-alcohol dehydrogenase-like predicted oxidoreductase
MNKGELDQTVLVKVQKLIPLAQQEGLSLTQLALAWCLRNPELSSVIIGSSKPEQVEENAGASGKTLSPETLKAIDQVLAIEPNPGV